MQKRSLRRALEAKEFVLAPGVYDMMSALMADKVGHEFVYASGFWLTASHLGLPDAGIATYTQMLDRVQTLAGVTKAAVIADADTGYGGLLNVHHTVRGYEKAGVAAIQIEDQVFPKKCGHTPNKQVVPVQDMVDKIRVATAARLSPETIVIARTDARQVEGFEGALARGKAYAEAGADVVFLEALQSVDEMRTACAALDKPAMANMVEGGRTPMMSPRQLQEIGYAIAIFPATGALAANAAVEAALRSLKTADAEMTTELHDFNEMCSILGFEEVWAFERKWART